MLICANILHSPGSSSELRMLNMKAVMEILSTHFCIRPANWESTWMENHEKTLYESACACVFQQLMQLTSVHWWDYWTAMATDCTMTQNGLHMAPAQKKKKYRLEWRQGDRQEPERGQTFGVTGTEGGIKQKSESNRPRDHVAEGAHPGALPELSQSRLISETSCPLSPQFTSAPPPVQPKLLCSPFAVLPGSGS